MNEEAYATLIEGALQDQVRISQLESSKAGVAHSHLVMDVQGLKDSLDNKANIGHDHEVSNIVELQNLLEQKADKEHSHSYPALKVKSDADHVATVSLSFVGSRVEGQGDVVVFPQHLDIYEGSTLVGKFPREIQVQSKLVFNSGLRVSAAGDQGEVITVDVSNAALGDYLNLTTGGLVEGSLGAPVLKVVDGLDSIIILDTSGAITLKGTEGEFGQVLTSGGTNSAAFWARPEASTNEVSKIRSGEFNDFSIGSAQDLNTHIRHVGVKNITLTLQADTVWFGNDSSMPIGGQFTIGKHGVGNILIQAGTGVVINAAEPLSLIRTNGKVTLVKVAANTWDLF